MTAIILQARIDSSRLPGKALLPLGGEPVVLRVMQALNRVPADLRVLACSEDSFRDFSPLARNASFEILAGLKYDVLERFCQVIRKFSIDNPAADSGASNSSARITRVIRATGDNPFVFADAASSINIEAQSFNADYAGYLELPYGAGVESAASSALLRAASESALPSDREHVCSYLYNNPNLFKIHRPLAPSRWNNPDIRLTIDTREDYQRACVLYSALDKEEQRYNGETIIKKYVEIFP
ncbi:MAG: spore coat protein [Treponema sp.]|nr:spore coat protein [Treponema sp.]